MKKSRYTDSQIINILKQAEAGTPVPELCREHGMSSASFYKWRAKYGGMDASLMGRMKELEAENTRLKKMYAVSASPPPPSLNLFHPLFSPECLFSSGVFYGCTNGALFGAS